MFWGDCTCIFLSPSATSRVDTVGHWRLASPAPCSHLIGPERGKDLTKAISVNEKQRRPQNSCSLSPGSAFSPCHESRSPWAVPSYLASSRGHSSGERRCSLLPALTPGQSRTDLEYLLRNWRSAQRAERRLCGFLGLANYRAGSCTPQVSLSGGPPQDGPNQLPNVGMLQEGLGAWQIGF